MPDDVKIIRQRVVCDPLTGEAAEEVRRAFEEEEVRRFLWFGWEQSPPEPDVVVRDA